MQYSQNIVGNCHTICQFVTKRKKNMSKAIKKNAYITNKLIIKRDEITYSTNRKIQVVPVIVVMK